VNIIHHPRNPVDLDSICRSQRSDLAVAGPDKESDWKV